MFIAGFRKIAENSSKKKNAAIGAAGGAVLGAGFGRGFGQLAARRHLYRLGDKAMKDYQAYGKSLGGKTTMTMPELRKAVALGKRAGRGMNQTPRAQAHYSALKNRIRKAYSKKGLLLGLGAGALTGAALGVLKKEQKKEAGLGSIVTKPLAYAGKKLLTSSIGTKANIVGNALSAVQTASDFSNKLKAARGWS